MSWSLQIHNGDIGISGTQFASVSGANKIAQDLRLTIMERMGTDDMHPEFGSLIDGGMLASGQQVPSLLGSNDWHYVAIQVESEIRRIAANYQSQQLNRIQQDQYKYGSSTIPPDEILQSITNVQMQQAQDTLLVTVTIQTGTGQQQTINLPVSNTI